MKLKIVLKMKDIFIIASLCLLFKSVLGHELFRDSIQRE